MDQLRQMLINLLADRFGLVAHRVMKDFDGYEIVVAKGGPKLTPSPANSTDRAEFRGTRDSNGIMHYALTRTSMSLMTNRLGILMFMKTPVLDHTGLSGRFNFTLDFQCADPSATSRAPRRRNSTTIRSTFRAAIEKQLGLKLNRLRVPREVLVIDHLERFPTPN